MIWKVQDYHNSIACIFFFFFWLVFQECSSSLWIWHQTNYKSDILFLYCHSLKYISTSIKLSVTVFPRLLLLLLLSVTSCMSLFSNCLIYFLSFLIGKKSTYNLHHKIPLSMYYGPLLGVMVGGVFSQSYLIAFFVTGVFHQISKHLQFPREYRFIDYKATRDHYDHLLWPSARYTTAMVMKVLHNHLLQCTYCESKETHKMFRVKMSSFVSIQILLVCSSQ